MIVGPRIVQRRADVGRVTSQPLGGQRRKPGLGELLEDQGRKRRLRGNSAHLAGNRCLQWSQRNDLHQPGAAGLQVIEHGLFNRRGQIWRSVGGSQFPVAVDRQKRQIGTARLSMIAGTKLDCEAGYKLLAGAKANEQLSLIEQLLNDPIDIGIETQKERIAKRASRQATAARASRRATSSLCRITRSSTLAI